MRRPRDDDDGAAAVEYALVVTAIAGVIVLVLWVLGGAVNGLFTDTCDEVSAKAQPTATC